MKELTLILFMSGALSFSPLIAKEISSVSSSIQQSYPISGKVTTAQKELAGATVRIVELQLVSVTDESGQFRFSQLPKGRYTLTVQFAGMKPTELQVSEGANVEVELIPNSIEIEDVQVIGERSNVKGATSTFISRQAIEHLQASSLAEVLQLLPGQAITNPSFSQVNTPMIRQIGSDPTGSLHDGASRNVASLGTSILINGAQLSNNGNMQAVNTATGGLLSSFSNATGMGTDLRQITADNIESIEVIRGIPSVEYGDLTSGVIDVKTKASVEPLQAKLRINPTLKQGWLGQGFAVGRDGGALFVDVDYTYAANNQIQTSESYQRFNSSLQYTHTLGSQKNLYTNSTLAFGGYYDDSKIDPDLVDEQVINQAENYDIRFSTNGRWNLDRKFARNINYVLSAQVGIQSGFQQRFNTGSITAVSNALEDITQEVDYLPSSYLQQIHLKGTPVNVQARLSDNFYLTTGRVNHAFLIGGSYSFEKNYGKGRYFADDLPPRTIDGIGFRSRAFKDIPALNQAAFFVEDKIGTHIAGRPLDIVAGLRYDAVQPFQDDVKSAFSPRVNASYQIAPGLKIRGGYGLSAKVMPLVYLYPDLAYADIFSLNYYKESEAERLALMTTRVFDTQNKDLEMAKSRKSEVGFDYNRLSVTYYNERIDNGYEMTQFYNFAQVPIYTVESQSPGEKPVLSDVVTDLVRVVDYNTPTNNVRLLNRGVDFDINFGRIAALRTSFTANGAYSYTKREGNTPFIYARQVATEPYDRLGVFEARGRDFTRFLTTLRAIHHIPEARLIVSLVAQTIWIDKDRYLNYSERPYGVIHIAEGGAGEVQLLTESEIAAIPETSGIFLSVADTYYREESQKPLWLFNTKVTKEFGKNYGFSFYVNNITNSRPFRSGTRNPTEFERKNVSIFFGSELTIKF